MTDPARFAERVAEGASVPVEGMGPRPLGDVRSPRRAAAAARAAGLTVVDLREETLRSVFNDIAAVIVFLRKVVWTVPDFTVERYRDRLAELHDRIETGARSWPTYGASSSRPGASAHGALDESR